MKTIILISTISFFLIITSVVLAALTLITQTGFEQTRAGNSSLPTVVFYRSDTFASNADEKSWPWLPLSADSYAGTYSLMYDFDKNEGENLVSVNFSVDESPIRIEFFVKPNITFVGNNPDESVQFLFYRTSTDQSASLCMNEIRYSNDTGLTKVERETAINVYRSNAGNGWKNITMTVEGCVGATNGYFYLTSTPDQYSGNILFDNFKIYKIT